MSNVEAIKKALEGVTVQEWSFDGPDDNIIIWCGDDTRVCFMTSDGPAKEHAKFITACNPAEISELITTLEALQRENAALRRSHDELQEEANELVVAQYTISARDAEISRLQAEIDRKFTMPGDHRYWEGRYRDEAAENERLRDLVNRASRYVESDLHEWHDDARQALASAGEHHAE